MTTSDGGLAERFHRLQAGMQQACAAAGRHIDDVRLVAVGKRHPASSIERLYALGQRDFGESYVQELVEKQRQLAHLPDIRWHFIGRVQKNKAKQMASCFMVHGASAARHVRALVDAGAERILLQVNLSDEAQKNGVAPDALRAMWPDVDVPQLQGLMTLPAPGHGREAFAALRELRDALQTSAHPLPQLSMGMSGDYADAIAEGATLIRVGTALFGPRPT